MQPPDWDWLKKHVFVKPHVEASEDFVRAVMARVGDQAPATPFMPAWRFWAASAAMAGLAAFLAVYPTTAQALDALLPGGDPVSVVLMED